MSATDNKIIYTVLVAILVAAVAITFPLMGGDAEAEPGDSQSEPYVQPAVQGQIWAYEPQFPEGYSPVVEIAYQGYGWSGTPGDYVTVDDDNTIKVTIPKNAQTGSYMFTIKASVTEPVYQEAYQYIEFQIEEKLSISNSSIATYVGDTVSWTPDGNGVELGATFSATKLPAGLTLNEDTGAITGKPTAASESTTYAITAETENQTLLFKVDISVEDTIVIGGSTTVSAFDDGTQEPAKVTSSISGVTWTIIEYDGLDGKVSVDQSGNITVNASTGDVGSHTIKIQASSGTTDQTVSKSITVSVAEKFAFGSPEFVLIGSS